MDDKRPLYTVIIAPSVTARLEAAQLWWRANRMAAPDLLEAEFATALGHLGQQPRIGRRARSRLFGKVRILLLPRTGYNVYYQVDESAREVRVVYFRHARRRPL